ncbi:hypothetical protein [Bremerella sp. P1]|uniref:hypothetical protein n=1 Tax=Bremerella sp. P1 TaxID=3026424 RepID=UPI00236760A3|nr:hypothetical protein [Bremerella sp. P1]WDI41496.1 hypothetical protein PSR63_23810 [Bremerella sp. P1]
MPYALVEAAAMAKYLRYLAHEYTPELGRRLVEHGPVRAGYIFDLFQLELKKTPSREIAKLVVSFTEVASQHLVKVEMLDVLDVGYYLNLNQYVTQVDHQRKQFFLSSIHETLLAFAEDYGWDRSQCTQVYERILANGIVFDRWWEKPVKHRGSGRTAQCHVSYEDNVVLSIGVRDKNGELLHKTRLATLPGTMGAVTSACAKLEWLDEAHLRLWQENQRDYWDYDVEADEVAYHYVRAERGDPHGQYDFAQMYFRGYIVDRDDGKALFWLTKSAEQNFGRAIKLLAKINAGAE